jgi:exopolyphosphatase/guanosine-5'-triphosphate,3'-diphosphate pyrophosphatase
MADPASPRAGARGRFGAASGAPVFAALDLGTNNCRLLIARPAVGGFRVIDSFSRIVRLGEGLEHSGSLLDAAIVRTNVALKICAQKVAIHQNLILRCIATQACRAAQNGAIFLEQVRRETGLAFEVISAEEEARLAVLGCRNLIDRRDQIALVVDIGGGSTELCWVDARGPEAPILAWTSLPIGVVSMAERFPERQDGDIDWLDQMRRAARAHVESYVGAAGLAAAFADGNAHIIGTSGAVSSLAGVHMGLTRYQRAKVDGFWMTRDEIAATTDRLVMGGRASREANGCIGPDRADLVIPGAAILQAVCDVWPSARIRVADRGLREGVLLELMAKWRG